MLWSAPHKEFLILRILFTNCDQLKVILQIIIGVININNINKREPTINPKALLENCSASKNNNPGREETGLD